MIRKLAVSLLVTAWLLASCARIGNEMPVLLYLAMAIDKDASIDTSTQADFRKRIELIADDYRKIHPHVQVQFELYEHSNLLKELKRRDASDLGPDLIITDTLQANELFAAQLTEAVPLPEAKRLDTETSLWERVLLSNGDIVGQPIAIFPQIACFNTTVIKRAPATLSALQQTATSGARVGLPVTFSELLWTASSLGALPSLARAGAGESLSTQNTESIQDWLRWLENASAQNNITFFEDQGQLENLLKDGELDWVSCNANSLPRLREALGDKLGVAALPDGPDGAASPVNDVRVLALGSNSSARQRTAAINLTHYITNAMVQRNLSLRSLAFLPVNPNVDISDPSSTTLTTLVSAQNAATQHEADLAGLVHQADRSNAVTPTLLLLIFGASNPQSSADALVQSLQSRP